MQLPLQFQLFSLSATHLTVFMMAVFNLVLSGLVYIHSQREKPEIFYAFIAFFASLWSLATLITSSAVSSLPLLKISTSLHYIGGLLAYLSFFWFSVFYVRRLPRSLILPILITGLNLLAIAFVSLPHYFFESVQLSSLLAARMVFNPVGYVFFVTTLSITYIITEIFVAQKYTITNGIERKRLGFIFAGTLFAGSFGIILNLILPALGVFSFFPLGPIFVTVFFTGMSLFILLRYKLFDIKVIAAELFVILLTLTLLTRLLLSRNSTDITINGASFVFAIGFGILLIRAVMKEVQQREQLQVLTDKLEKANTKLQELDQARADFITMASHQLRTPPSTLKWYLASILSGDFGRVEDELKTALNKMQFTNNSMISLVDDMLNASRIERGKIEFNFEPADILGMVRFTVEQLRALAEPKHLQLTFVKPKLGLPKIMTDKEKLRQVINNLIDNAIKYTKSGQITVALSKTAKEIILKVTDTGKGIAKEDQKNLFEKYARPKDSSKYTSGLGLGLYLAKVIVEQHAGKIWAESEGIDRGSTFIISLPIKSDIKPTATFDLAKNK